jgi:hypothetical protein
MLIAAALSAPGCAQVMCDSGCDDGVSGSAAVEESALTSKSVTACRDDECVSTGFRREDLMRAEQPSFAFVMEPIKGGVVSFRFDPRQPRKPRERYSVRLIGEGGSKTFSWEQNVARDRMSCTAC